MTLDDRTSQAVYGFRWVLLPINAALFLGLAVYVAIFLRDTAAFLGSSPGLNLESCMVVLLGMVDAAMVANLVLMISQGSHHIFISKFAHAGDGPQWLDHIDSGILKVKTALSIAGITLVQLLRDFTNLEHVEWELVVRRAILHGVALASALVMAAIWRITHPPKESHA